MTFHILKFVTYFLSIPLVITSAFTDASHQPLGTSGGKYVFKSGDRSYLSDLDHPKASFSGKFNEVASNGAQLGLITVINTDERLANREILENLVTRYKEQDDVYSEAFLEGVYISSTSESKSVLDQSALDFLAESNTRYLFVDASSFMYSVDVTGPYVTTYVKIETTGKGENLSIPGLENVAQQAVLSQDTPLTRNLPSGPYVAKLNRETISLSLVYRLYPDEYSDFLFGAYEIDNDDDEKSFEAVDIFEPKSGSALVPVPSRIYSWDDARPLAGQRVAIKDLYDIKGLQTAGGSRAWAAITDIANVTAPSVQQIIDLGGVIVGKFKTAQFAAGVNPWDWIDYQYPFNPRGDGQLTCSGSSSGGGCAIAAYDWLDFAIGSDTGSSMRIPAAASGTYGNRPSQGLMTLEGVLPLSEALDTAGVFSRDPIKWIKFAKAWYHPSLHQPPSTTGLPPLHIPSTTAFPTKLLYLTNYLPLANPAAEVLLQNFITNVSSIFNLTVCNFNLIAAIKAANTTPPILDTINIVSTIDNILDGKGQWDVIARPLIDKWAAINSNRFPPIEPVWRTDWQNYSNHNISDTIRHAHYASALSAKNASTTWFNENILNQTAESCSESIMIYDVGMQGLPEFRDEKTNNDTGSFVWWTGYFGDGEGKGTGKEKWEEGSVLRGTGICPAFGCVDFTVPIGQVGYRSNVTFVEEMVPVTVSLVARRGCDFMLFNMIEILAREGVLKTVKTGREAF